MLGTRHEEYEKFIDGLPFIFNHKLKRDYFNRSKENNWHDNLEIQLCTEGSGTVLLDGKAYPFNKNDIIVVNSNVIHYTGTDTSLTYSCLIISNEFCKQVGIDPINLTFEPFITSDTLANMVSSLAEIYTDQNLSCRKAKLNKIVLEMLIELAERHAVQKTKISADSQKYEAVKSAIIYIRDNYGRKISLDEISKAVFTDKYALCREFKRLTGQTVVENLNNYRCIKAIEHLSNGYTVAEAAELCGFESLSFFTKTFKKHIGALPSDYKKRLSH